jgi:hypothetical protein
LGLVGDVPGVDRARVRARERVDDREHRDQRALGRVDLMTAFLLAFGSFVFAYALGLWIGGMR